MAKASVLGSVACGFRMPAIRLLWASRNMQSFSTTLRVPNLPKLKSPQHIIAPPESSPSEDSRRTCATECDDVNPACAVAQDIPAVPEHEIANDDASSELEQEADLGEQKVVPWMDSLGRLSQTILHKQDYYSLLHKDLLKNILRRTSPVRRGMPVNDTTYEAVRSRRNLFIKTERPVRSLQYLLPAVQSILNALGSHDRPRKVKRRALLPVRPLSLLVLCPTSGQAEEVEQLCTKLLDFYKNGIRVASLRMPSFGKVDILEGTGYHVLTSTPEHIIQWLALPRAKAVLNKALQDVEMFVVDGKASALRGAEFRELMQGVMEDALLPDHTQRIITSDTFDPKLDEGLAKLVLRGDYDLDEDPRLKEIKQLERAQDYIFERRREMHRQRWRYKASRKSTRNGPR